MLLEALAVVDTCVMHSAALLSPVKSSTVLAKPTARPHNVFVGVTWYMWPRSRYMGVIFNGISQLGNEHLAVIRSSGVAVLQGFGYCGSLCKFILDQSFWPLYRGWLL